MSLVRRASFSQYRLRPIAPGIQTVKHSIATMLRRWPAVRQRRHIFSAIPINAATDDNKRRLAEHGYVPFSKTPFGVLDHSTVENLRARLPLLFRGEFDTGVYPDEMHWREGISKEEAPREIVNAWKADRTVAAVVLSEELGSLAASLAGWKSARVAQDDVVWKPPGSGPVAFHQDSAYISRQFVPAANNSVTMWMALDGCDREVGTIEYAKITDHMRPGTRSTISPNKPARASFHGADALNYRAPAEEAAQNLGRQVEFDAVAVPPGGCVVHAQDCWHGSGPNISRERHRRALVVHFLRGDARFIEGHSLEGTGGPSYIYSRYKRLGSTELAEEAFPVTFSQDGYRTPWIEAYLSSKSSG